MCSAHHSTSSLTLHVIHGALHDATTHVDENTQQLTVWLFHLICYFDHLYDVLFCCIYCDNVCTNNHYLLVLFVLSILCVCADCLFDYLLFWCVFAHTECKSLSPSALPAVSPSVYCSASPTTSPSVSPTSLPNKQNCLIYGFAHDKPNRVTFSFTHNQPNSLTFAWPTMMPTISPSKSSTAHLIFKKYTPKNPLYVTRE
jgi:hypothetical protein